VFFSPLPLDPGVIPLAEGAKNRLLSCESEGLVLSPIESEEAFEETWSEFDKEVSWSRTGDEATNGDDCDVRYVLDVPVHRGDILLRGHSRTRGQRNIGQRRYSYNYII
jgi:hypothetical protein